MSDEKYAEQLRCASVMLAAAFWRGKLLQAGLENNWTLELLIKAAAEHDAPQWEASAKIIVNR